MYINLRWERHKKEMNTEYTLHVYILWWQRRKTLIIVTGEKRTVIDRVADYTIIYWMYTIRLAVTAHIVHFVCSNIANIYLDHIDGGAQALSIYPSE